MRLLLLAGLFFIPFLSNAGAGQTQSSSSGPIDPRKQLEQDVFLLVNQYRQAQELPLLKWDDTVAQEARNHSRDMATGDVDFGHDGFNQRFTRLKAALTGLRGAGENVLRTNDPEQVAQRAVASWLKSPHHLENIRGDYNYSGLGIWQDDQGMLYFTQIFVKLEPPVQASPAQTAQAQDPATLITPLGVVTLPIGGRSSR